jgi:small conductance mechanosensitive channel
VAAIGALSLGAGLAMQGLLANYAAGLNIIITRPFIVGDTIEVQRVTGLVKKVQLAYTMLIDEDGTEITIPNRHIVGEIIHNSYSNMLAEISIGIAYSEDAPRAILIIMQALAKVEELQDIQMPLDEEGVPKTEQKLQVGIGSFGASGVNLSVRAWLPTSKFHQLRFKLNAAIYSALNENNVKIPFPQHEVRMLND